MTIQRYNRMSGVRDTTISIETDLLLEINVNNI